MLSQGTDPMGEFMAFTRDRMMDERVAAISLGQGQGPVAERAISEATKTGDWVFLQVSPSGGMCGGDGGPAAWHRAGDWRVMELQCQTALVLRLVRWR